LEAQTLINNNYVADMVIYLKIETEQAVTRLLPGRIKMEEEKFKQRTLNKNIKDPKKSDESDESGESGGIEDDESEKDEFPENPEEFYSDELNEE